MKTQKITLVTALFLNKFDKEFLQVVQQDLQTLKARAVRKNSSVQIAL